MATTTRLPVGDGIIIDWVPKGAGTNFSEVNEGVASADDDATEVTQDTNGNNFDFYILQDMPSDFDTAIDVTHKLRVHQTGRVDDNCDIRLSVYESDEDTPVEFGDDGDVNEVTSYTTFIDASAKANTDTKAEWNTYRLLLLKTKIASAMADSMTFFCTAVEVVINYTSTAGAVRNRYHITSS